MFDVSMPYVTLCSSPHPRHHHRSCIDTVASTPPRKYQEKHEAGERPTQQHEHTQAHTNHQRYVISWDAMRRNIYVPSVFEMHCSLMVRLEVYFNNVARYHIERCKLASCCLSCCVVCVRAAGCVCVLLRVLKIVASCTRATRESRNIDG